LTIGDCGLKTQIADFRTADWATPNCQSPIRQSSVCNLQSTVLSAR
jgi:hypothetical protein